MEATPEQPPASQPLPEGATHLLSRADLAFALTVVASLILVLVLYLAFPAIVAVFVLSSVVAYALVPFVDRLEREGLGRTVGVLLVAVGGAGFLALVGTLMAPAVVKQIQAMPEALTKMVEEVQSYWGHARNSLPSVVVLTTERALGGIQQSLTNLDLSGGGTLTRYATTAATGVTAVAGALVLIPVFVFLMLRGYHGFVGGFTALIPPRWRPRFEQRTGEVDLVLSGFIRGQLTVAFILVILYSTAFSIIGIPLAILVGILAGFGELIPYIGNAIALTLGSLLALAGGHPIDVVWVIAVYTAIQILQSTVISPFIMGKRVRLSPVTIIVALAIGAELLGLMGMLLAVPSAALLKVAARSALSAWRLSGFYRREASA